MAVDKNKEEKATVVENLDSHLTKAGQKVANNKKIIYICAGVIGIVAAFVLSYLFIYRNPRLQNSWEAFNKVYLMQQKGEFASDSITAEEYQKVSVNFSGTPAGNVAALAAAEAFFDVKNYDKAIELLKKIDLSEPVLEAQAQALLGDAYTHKDKWDDALASYDKAIKIADGNPQLVPAYLIKKANVYDLQGKYGEALACYEEIKTNYPTYNYGEGIDFYIENEKAKAGK